MTDYTPTTSEVRDVWAAWSDYGGLTNRPRSGTSDDRYAEFDRWLAARDVEVRAQALREAASAPIPRAALNTRNNGLRQWLRARADRIERGE